MSLTESRSQLMTGSEIDRTLVRLAHEVLDKNRSPESLFVIGIHRRGAVLGERLAAKLSELAGAPIPVGSLEIRLYEDDLTKIAAVPVLRGTQLPVAVENRDVVLVDDVLYTGSTVRRALDALFAQGHPRSVQLCVLIDRGHRTLPIEAGFVGKHVETTDSEVVEVKVQNIDHDERVLLVERINEA